MFPYSIAVNMSFATLKPTSSICGNGMTSDAFCMSLKRRGRRMNSAHRAISTDKTVEQQQQQTASASGNITPFSNITGNDVHQQHPFLLVRQVTDMIIRTWVNSGEDAVLDMVDGSEEPGCPATYHGESPSQEVPMKNLKKREQVHAMLLDWDRFA